MHHGKLTRAWLARHPRFRMHFTPVHCSWMNQIEQWFSILRHNQGERVLDENGVEGGLERDERRCHAAMIIPRDCGVVYGVKPELR